MEEVGAGAAVAAFWSLRPAPIWGPVRAGPSSSSPSCGRPGPWAIACRRLRLVGGGQGGLAFAGRSRWIQCEVQRPTGPTNAVALFGVKVVEGDGAGVRFRCLPCLLCDQYRGDESIRMIRRTAVLGWSLLVRSATSGIGTNRQRPLMLNSRQRSALPAPPPGRIWLLRSPWPSVGLKVVLWFFARHCQERGVHGEADFVAAAREMLRWDEAQLWAWWTGEEKDAARAWQAQGRTGEDVAELVYAGIGPHELARMPGLTFEQAAAWRWAAAGQTLQAAVDRVVFFRSTGLPDTPPENLYRLEGLTDQEIRAWIAAGFDVPTMVALIGSTLTEAIAWRDHGYSAARAEELLQVDSALTAADVDAFTAAGIVGRHQIDWIQYGFNAAGSRRIRRAGYPAE